MEELTEVDAVHSNYLRTVNVAYTEVGRVERGGGRFSTSILSKL